MAEVFPDTAGAFAGRLGRVSYYVTRDGRNMVRKKRAPKSKRRRKRTERNDGFGALSELGRGMLDVIRKGFPERPGNWTAWNAFMSHNKEAVTGKDRREVDFGRLACSWGSLRPPRAEATVEGATVRFAWEAEGNSFGGRTDDAVHAALLWREAGTWFGAAVEAGARGTGGSAEWTLPDSPAEVRVYAFVLSADGRKASPSVPLA